VLFNLDKAKSAMRQMEFALLVEGQMDCISVYMRGIQNVIATSGTAFTEQQVGLLRRQTSNVVVNFDPDAAGANAAEKSIALLTEEGFTIKVVTLDGGLDPDRFIRERGVEAYAAAIRGARRQSDYLIERARQQFPGSSSDAKIKAMNYLLPHIRRIPQKLERDQFAHDAAQKLDIDSAVLREELRQAALKRQDHIETRSSTGLLPWERFFIEAACNDSKSQQEYDALHANLSAFDRKLKDAGANWEDLLQNFPARLLERLLARRLGEDIEHTAETEEQRILLHRVFLEAGELTRTHEQDMEIVRDLEIRALRGKIAKLRTAVEVATDRNSLETIRLSQEILQLERKLRELECES